MSVSASSVARNQPEWPPVRDSTGSLLCEISGPCPILSEFRVHGLAAADLKEAPSRSAAPGRARARRNAECHRDKPGRPSRPPHARPRETVDSQCKRQRSRQVAPAERCIVGRDEEMGRPSRGALRARGGPYCPSFLRSPDRLEPRLQTWVHQRDNPQVPALHIYSGADGAFSIEDDHRDESDDAPLNFTARETWDGKPARMEGVVRDWVSWQLSGKEWFSVFERVRSRLSPTDLGTLQSARPTRMPGDSRMIPVICHPYGRTPLLYASASVRRIMALTYVVGWA